MKACYKRFGAILDQRKSIGSSIQKGCNEQTKLRCWYNLTSLITDTFIVRTPLYYGQFVWSQKCQKSYTPYLYNTDTSVKRTLGSVPLVSVLKRFDCGKNVLVVYQLLVKFRTRIATKTGQIIGSGELSSPVGLIHKKG